MRLGNELELKTPEEEDSGAIVAIGRTVGSVTGAAVGIGIGVAAAAASGIGSKAQTAGSSAIAAANASPQAVSSGIDAVTATDEVFSFVDQNQNTEGENDVEADNTNSVSSEFEGLGSLFD